jgi:hypothetical protein
VARFSQTFLQGLLQPSYQQGLFEAARGIGMTPGLMALEKERKEKMQKMAQMGPVDLAKYAEQEAAKTGDPTKVLQARQTTQDIVQQQTQQSLDQLNIQRSKALQAGKLSEAKAIEEIMERVASESGLDSSKITGKTDEEFAQIESQREANFIKAYYFVKPENLEQFVKAAQDAGYGASIQKLEDDRIQRDENNRKIEEGKKDRTKPLPITGVESRLEGLPSELQDDLKQRIADIKALEPNFEKGETWTPGGRQNAERQLLSIENQITQYKVSTLQKLNTTKRELQGQINSARSRLNKLVAKDPSGADIDQYIPQAKENVNAREASGFFDREIKANDPRVKAEAVVLARQQQEIELKQQRSQEHITIQELEEQLRLVDAELGGDSKKETEVEDPLGFRNQ